MPTSSTRLTGWQRSSGLVASALLGLMMFLLCWQGAAAQAPALAALPANTVWFVNNQPGEGLVGYWKFDQVVNTTTVNSALLTNAATFSNGVSISTTVLPPLGIPNFQKLSLNGVNQFLLVPDAPALDVPVDHFSVAAWVRRTTTGTSDLIYDSGENLHHWYFGFLGSDNKLAFTTNNQTDYRSTHVVTDTLWHHVAVVKNGSGPGNLLIYLDGVAAPPITATVTAAPTGTKTIGIKNVAFNTPFAGDLDELRLYNRALSGAEVLRLAQGRGCASDGLTWSTAFADLQCALSAAITGDEIWVAKSFEPYRPGTNIQASFNLKSRVGLFGNFQGTELSRGQRPPVNFELGLVTRLSGDLLDDDSGPGVTDNARHVVRSASPGPGTVLDGVRVEAGFNSAPFSPPGSGAGLLQQHTGQLLVANSLFIQNQAGSEGGGMYAEATLGLDNVIFEANSADAGGGVFLLGTTVITAGQFQSNSARSCGGLLNLFGTLAVSGTQFNFNRASDLGGGACTERPASVNGAVFLQNQAAQGGGLYATEALTVSESQFLSNTAGDGGGGLLALNRAIVHGGLFAGNSATGTLSLGGAISVEFGLKLDGAQFVGNSAASGGALSLAFGASRFTDTVFLANRATAGDGGALRVHNTAFSLTNALLVGNLASNQGGAIFLDHGGTSLAQVTAVSNSAGVTGSVLFANQSNTQLFNSIIWHNGSGAIGQQGSAISFVFNLGDTGIVDTGDISGDPIFARNPNPGDGNWATLGDNDYGDLRLTGGSPGIDAGNNTLLLTSPTTDLAGQPRFVDIASVPDTGLGAPPIVDMGAYEFHLLELFLPVLMR